MHNRTAATVLMFPKRDDAPEKSARMLRVERMTPGEVCLGIACVVASALLSIAVIATAWAGLERLWR